MVTKKHIFIFAFCLVAVGIIWFFISKTKKLPCKVTSEIFETNKKNDIFPAGKKVQIDHNYYFCHDVNLGDVIAVSTFQSQKSGEEPSKGFEFRKILIFPKDHVELVKKANMYQVIVNGSLIKDFNGRESFRSEQVAHLRFFTRKYKNIIPADTYFTFSKSQPRRFQYFSKTLLKDKATLKE